MVKDNIILLLTNVEEYFIQLGNILGMTSTEVKWLFVLFIALGLYGILLRIAWVDRLRRK